MPKDFVQNFKSSSESINTLLQSVAMTVTASNSAGTIVGNVYVPKTPKQYSYALEGSMLSDGRWNYTWMKKTAMIAMESISTVLSAAKRRLEFVYDYMGRRIAKTPISKYDFLGLAKAVSCRCGPDVTLALRETMLKVSQDYWALDFATKKSQ